MNIKPTQITSNFRDIFQEQIDIFQTTRIVNEVSEIPEINNIPFSNPSEWLKIPNVICVFVDMIGSTKLSANKHEKSTAGLYQLFTNTAVKIFDELNSPYIDVKGDGVFALFNSQDTYKALVGAITFKTFVNDEFLKRISIPDKIKTGCHIGIDQKTVLVRKLGLKSKKRTDRQNEVWAGKPINMAAKLASISEHNQIMVSDRFYKTLLDKKAIYKCKCHNSFFFGKEEAWQSKSVAGIKNFDFNKAYYMEHNWCPDHGQEYIDYLLSL